jgi:hypothetical protein
MFTAKQNSFLRRIIILMFLLISSLTNIKAQSNEEPKRWAIEIGAGGVTLDNNSPDNQAFYLSDDEGHRFFTNMDYFLTKRLALSGGIYFQQDGVITDLDDGIGLKKINKMGLSSGAKFYFFPQKWIVQPHIGAALQTNFLNLGTAKGSEKHIAKEGYPNSSLQLQYDIQCPALTVNPKIGIDIRLLSSLSFCVDYDIYYGFWGHNRSNVTFLSGPLTGQSTIHSNSNLSTGFNIGLKLDFPVRPVSDSTWSNLLMLLFGWIAPNHY